VGSYFWLYIGSFGIGLGAVAIAFTFRAPRPLVAGLARASAAHCVVGVLRACRRHPPLLEVELALEHVAARRRRSRLRAEAQERLASESMTVRLISQCSMSSRLPVGGR